MMTTGKAVELIIAALPYPKQIRDWDLDSELGAIRFTWRGTRYRFSYTNSLFIEEVRDSMLVRSDHAYLMDGLIHQFAYQHGFRKVTD